MVPKKTEMRCASARDWTTVRQRCASSGQSGVRALATRDRMFIEGSASCDQRFGVHGAKAVWCESCVPAVSSGRFMQVPVYSTSVNTSFREHLPSPHSVELALMKSSIGADTVSFPLLRDTEPLAARREFRIIVH